MPPIESLASGEAASDMAMTHGMTFSDMLNGSSLGMGWTIFQLAVYIFMSYCQYTLSKKLGVQHSWMAWVPVLSSFNLVKIAGKSYWWVLWMFLGFIALLIPGIILTIMMYHGISKRTGHGGWWTTGLFFFGFIFLPITAFTYNPPDTPTQPTTPAI